MTRRLALWSAASRCHQRGFGEPPSKWGAVGVLFGHSSAKSVVLHVSLPYKKSEVLRRRAGLHPSCEHWRSSTSIRIPWASTVTCFSTVGSRSIVFVSTSGKRFPTGASTTCSWSWAGE
jgi:hypothetical protein